MSPPLQGISKVFLGGVRQTLESTHWQKGHVAAFAFRCPKSALFPRTHSSTGHSCQQQTCLLASSFCFFWATLASVSSSALQNMNVQNQ